MSGDDMLRRDDILAAIGNAAYKHLGHDAYSSGMDAGARFQTERDLAAVRALPAATPRPMAEVQQRAYIDGLRGAADTVRSIRSSVPITPESVAGILDGIAAKAKVDASVKGVQDAHTPRPMKDAPQRFVARAVLTEEGWCGTMRPANDGGWVLWDDVAHLFPHPPEGGSDG